MKYFILSILLILANLAHSQNEKLELGIDFLPILIPTIQGKGGAEGFEVFVKSILKNGELRLKIGYSKEPIHDSRMIERVTGIFNGKHDYLSTHYPKDYYFLNLGYAQKHHFKKSSFIYGIDFRIAKYNAESIIDKYFTFGGRQPNFKTFKSNYSSFGLLPFIGYKLNVVSNIFINLEIGIIGNLVFGKYAFYNNREDEVALPFNRFESNWGMMTNDLSISYIF